MCETSVTKKKVSVTWGQSVHLGCAVRMPELRQPVSWLHHSKDKGRQQLHLRPDKYIETSDHGLVMIGVREADAGRYDCFLGASLLCSYNITVDAHRCSAPTKSHDYQKVYSDWCHEFEKYKQAMKSWQRKQQVRF